MLRDHSWNRILSKLLRGVRMRATLSLVALVLMAVSSAHAQIESVKVTIRAILVDKDLNQKPIPRLLVSLTRTDVTGSEPHTARTNFDGILELQVPPGPLPSLNFGARRIPGQNVLLADRCERRCSGYVMEDVVPQLGGRPDSQPGHL
jgi:hypothetical protein